MDSEVPNIEFDPEGHCNYCNDFVVMIKNNSSSGLTDRKVDLQKFVQRVKRDGKGRQYDCIIGVSGGVDSAWVLLQAKKMGLRPLAVHMDNGWNSELAQNNIEGLVRTLEVDLYTHVIDWVEYRELMQAFFDADVVDVELLYDNAMFAVNYRLAAKHGIKWILAGTNQSTEGMRMPSGWNWFKFDAFNIRQIARRRKITRLITFPAISVLDYVWFEYVNKIKWISFLDLMDYRKDDALIALEHECGYRRYPYKHYESIFTRFYQGYILPQKFGIDKRKLHLSTLVVTEQMARDEALKLLAESPYQSQAHLEEDKVYFLKKMGWSSEDLSCYINRPSVSHSLYGSESWRWFLLSRIYKLLSRFKS